MVVVKDALKCTASLSHTEIYLIEVIGMSVIGNGWDGKLGIVIGGLREMSSTVCWLSFLRNLVGWSFLDSWRGVLCQLLLCPVDMSFLIPTVCSDQNSSQLGHIVPSCFPCCICCVGIACLPFLHLVLTILATLEIVIVSLVLRLQES